MSQISSAFANDLATAALNAFGGGYLYLYNSNDGTIPATANEALDLTPTTGNHTQLAKITINGDGTTGLEFIDPVVGNALTKVVADVWEGEVEFTGRVSTGTLAPTFFRFVDATDATPGGATTTKRRLQGSAGGPSSGAECQIGTDTVTDNDANVQVINFMQVIFDLT